MIPAYIEAGRSFIGTPWCHRGREPGRRLDCIGELVCAFLATGRAIQDRKFYGRDPEKDQLRAALVEEFGPPLPKALARCGDIGLFRGFRYPLHVGFITDYRGLGVLHASNAPGVMKVVEHELAAHWRNRFIEVYRPEGTHGRS